MDITLDFPKRADADCLERCVVANFDLCVGHKRLFHPNHNIPGWHVIVSHIVSTSRFLNKVNATSIDFNLNLRMGCQMLMYVLV